LIDVNVDPDAVDLGDHPSTRRAPNEFSRIKINAKDWSNLLRVSVVAKSMLACIVHFSARLMKVFVKDMRWCCMCILQTRWVGKDPY